MVDVDAPEPAIIASDAKSDAMVFSHASAVWKEKSTKTAASPSQRPSRHYIASQTPNP